MMTNMIDHAALISALGGAAKVAETLVTLPVNVRAWSARNRIPPEYWPSLIKMAGEIDVTVSADWLMRTTPARASRSTPVEQREAA